MTPPRLGRKHLIFGAVITVIGMVLIFDALSSPSHIVRIGGLSTIARDSWFFRDSPHDYEFMWGLFALAGAIVWVGGSVGWWIVRTIIQLWLHKAWRDANPR